MMTQSGPPADPVRWLRWISIRDSFAASLFNDGEYLEASDFFEDLFFEGVRDEPDFVRIFLQFSVGIYHAETGQLRPAVERIEEGLRLVASNRDDHRIDLLALASAMRVGVRNLRHKIKPEWSEDRDPRDLESRAMRPVERLGQECNCTSGQSLGASSISSADLHQPHEQFAAASRWAFAPKASGHLLLLAIKIVRWKTKLWQMVGRGTRLSPNLFGPRGRTKSSSI